jgi:alpha-beta hydrolase superfamily lysophospholipase/SAM-dependent methyltransferase
MSESPSLTAETGSDFVASEHTMKLSDGVELFYRAWLPKTPTEKALVIFHRGHEHSGRVQDIVEALNLPDVAIFAWDARGHGRTPGERGYASSFAALVSDVDCFMRHISQTYDKRLENMVVLAQSVGAVTVAAWVHDYAPRIRAMILAAPALEIKLYVPLAIPGLRLLLKMRKNRKTFIKSYVKARMLTHDRRQARRYEEDSLISREIAANVLVDLHDTAARLIDDAGAIRVPTLLLAAGSDWVVKLGPQQRLFERLGAPIKRMKVFPGMYHDLLHEKDRHLVLDETRQFIREAFDRDAAPPPLLDADRYGHTRNEYDRLVEPLPWRSLRGLSYRVQRLGMQTFGRLSRGVRLGWRTGFDSGQTLDYVYENQPQGAMLVGKWIDRAYLESIGWRGIRQRRINLEKLLHEAVRRLREEGQPVRLVDIAAGPGRYILEVLHSLAGDDLSALLRDNVEANLEAGRKLATQLGLSNVTFQLGDAFDEASLAAIEPSPNVAIVSGLYELFGDNELVRRSLRGLARAVQPGGYLVYTGQPWHPQLEMIARVLTNRDGRPWIMRRRTQGEMDDLVRDVGFEKMAQETDPWGIFTVSLARRAAD